jgi:hypothetical protein
VTKFGIQPSQHIALQGHHVHLLQNSKQTIEKKEKNKHVNKGTQRMMKEYTLPKLEEEGGIMWRTMKEHTLPKLEGEGEVMFWWNETLRKNFIIVTITKLFALASISLEIWEWQCEKDKWGWVKSIKNSQQRSKTQTAQLLT